MQTNCFIKDVKDGKITKLTKRTANVMVAVAVSADFQAEKSHIVVPEPGSSQRMKNQILPAPHSGTFNGSKCVKKIRQPFYSPHTATADFFLFERGKKSWQTSRCPRVVS
jgi:hypothetical protein